MAPSTSAELLGGSLEGSLRRQEPVRDVASPREPAVHVEPPESSDRADRARDPDSPMVLYGRLGYIARSAIQRD